MFSNFKIRPWINDLEKSIALIFKADKRNGMINILLQLLQALLPIASLYYIKLLIEALTANKGEAGVVMAIAGFSITQIGLVIVSQYAAYVTTVHQQKVTDFISTEVLYKATQADYRYYENPVYHDTLHLAQQQSLYRFPQLIGQLSLMLQNILSLFLLIVFFFSMHAGFALAFLVLSVPLAIVKWYYGVEVARLDRKFAAEEREANYLYTTLTHVNFAKEVRLFGYGDNFIEKFKRIKKFIADYKNKMHHRLTLYGLIAEIFEVIAMLLIFFFLAKETSTKLISIGAFIIYLQGFQRMQSTTKSFLQSFVQLFQLRIFLQDIFYFFQMAENNIIRGTKTFPSIINNGLTVKNISFAYPFSNKTALKNVSISCAPGQIIAIVGENGSGKSTFVKLLARLYHLQSGKIEIDNYALNDINIQSFRTKATFLFQDFEKYFFTVEENIALGEEPDSSRIEWAAKLSGADSFIKKLNNGYKTRMGTIFQGSEQLSGGQWQKIALTRIFYREAQLVVLDEPTSALDANAELKLFENLKNFCGNKMIILITHRLYNLKIADKIYVLDEGQIVQHGTYKALLEEDGLFRKMYNAQQL